MKRIIAPNPLEGAAPALRPTARPFAIQGGATPAPRRSPLGELAQSFDGFNDHLKGILSDVAIREEQDAATLGEQMAAADARKAAAGERMAAIEDQLKEAVDAGKLPRVRLPAFERAYRTRAGQERASSLFQTQLMGTIEQASRLDGERLDPEKAIADAYKQASQGLAEGDVYARAGFDRVAQGIIQNYRSQVNARFLANKERDAETKAADEGSELLVRLAGATTDEEPEALFALNDHFAKLRKEFPKHEVNSFFARGALNSAVRDLVSQGKTDEAERLIEHVEKLDLTGEGGLFSKTKDGMAVLADLRRVVEVGHETRPHRDYAALKARRDLDREQGEQDAVKLLADLEQKGQLQGLRDVQPFREKYGKDWAGPQNADRYAGFVETLEQKFDQRIAAMRDPLAVADLLRATNEVSPDTIDALRGQVRLLRDARTISAEDDQKLTTALRQQEALFSRFTGGDIAYLQAGTFSTAPLASGLGRSINFGEPSAQEQAILGTDPKTKIQRDLGWAWESLPAARRDEIQMTVTKSFRDSVLSQMRKGNPDTLDADKLSVYLPEALKGARELARKLTLGALQDTRQATLDAAVAGQRQVITQAKALVPTEAPLPKAPVAPASGELDPDFEVTKKSTLSGREYTETQTTRGVKSGLALPVTGPARYVPMAERDEVVVPMKGFFGERRVVLPEVAAALADEKAAPQERQKAALIYGVAKSCLGFTPDEVKAGVTKHGVPFTAAEIDATRVPVFRTTAELKKHRSPDGTYSEEFLDLLNRVEPGMKPAAFYAAQLAVLTARNQ